MASVTCSLGGATTTLVVLLLCWSCVDSLTLPASEPLPESCMQSWILKAGIPYTSIQRHEANLKRVGITEAELSTIDASYLAFFLGQNIDHADRLQACLRGNTDECRAHPCNTGGTCKLVDAEAAAGPRYQCRCSAGKGGPFCTELDACSSNPCQNGGVCEHVSDHYTCHCAVGFEGEQCQKKWLLVDQYRHLPDNVSNLVTEIRTLQLKVGALERMHSTCRFSSLGYQFSSKRISVPADAGQINSMIFDKRQSATLLRVSYSANIRIRPTGTTGRWYLKIDGQECTSPGAIDIVMYQSDAEETHVPSVLAGICHATTAGAIASGNHTLSIHVAGTADTHSGWESVSFFEAQEICPV